MDNYSPHPEVDTPLRRDAALVDLGLCDRVRDAILEAMRVTGTTDGRMDWVESADTMTSVKDRLADCLADLNWAINHIEDALNEEPVR